MHVCYFDQWYLITLLYINVYDVLFWLFCLSVHLSVCLSVCLFVCPGGGVCHFFVCYQPLSIYQ